MFRGGPSLVGVAAGSLRAPMELRWSFKTEGPVKSSAALVQDRVYVGSDDGNVYALGLGDGRKAWAFKTGGEVESSPLALEGRVYVGSSDNFLYALNAADGKPVWKCETGDKILGGPNWVKSGSATLILVGSYDFKLHAVEAASGKAAWTCETGNYINGSPGVADGQAVFGGCDGLLHVIGLADGKQLKEVEAARTLPGRRP